MTTPNGDQENARDIADDIRTLEKMGYHQELLRRLSGFSNYAISMSIICILAGGVTSFHIGYCAIGGAAIGLGWPLVCLFSLAVALTMGQVASAFPTSGGLYHWASILGGKGWGWGTAWFNIAGLATVLAAIDVGLYQFIIGAWHLIDPVSAPKPAEWIQHLTVAAIMLCQGVINHRGVRLTTRLTDFSGWWILGVALILTVSLLFSVTTWDFGRLIRFTNYSGLPVGDNPVWPASGNIPWLFLLALLLPAYTLTGFDASAHAAEETIGAARHVPQGIVRSVVVSGIFGWLMLSAVVLAMPDMDQAATAGDTVFVSTLIATLPPWLVLALVGSIALAQFLCGLATVTASSRMLYAFARDGGLPCSHLIRRVGRHGTPGAAIFVICLSALAFTWHNETYTLITLVSALFLSISYVVPTMLGLIHYRKVTWGPWHLGIWFRPLAVFAMLASVILIILGMIPPNEEAAYLTGGFLLILAGVWHGWESKRFQGPPNIQGLRQKPASP